MKSPKLVCPKIESSQTHVAGKMQMLDKLLPELKRGKHQILLYSQMTRMLDILEEYMMLRQYSYCRIDGSVAQVERENQVSNSPCFHLLASLPVGALLSSSH